MRATPDARERFREYPNGILLTGTSRTDVDDCPESHGHITGKTHDA